MTSPDHAAMMADRMVKVQRHTIPAMLLDLPMREIDASEWWDDCFLTNVVVPHLEHMRMVFEEDLKNMVTEHPTKLTMDSTAIKALAKDINTLNEAIHICQEWRG